MAYRFENWFVTVTVVIIIIPIIPITLIVVIIPLVPLTVSSPSLSSHLSSSSLLCCHGIGHWCHVIVIVLLMLGRVVVSSSCMRAFMLR